MQPLPWSFSTLNRFVTCPRQYHAIHVVKRIKDVEGEAAKWGNAVHSAIEHTLKDEQPLPKEMEQFQDYVDSIRARPGKMLVENQLALNKQLQPTNFFAKDVWVRGKADVIHINGDVATGLDHKTGKRKASSQMVLMALLMFHHYPEVQKIKTAFCWLKTGEIDTDEYTRAEIDTMWQVFVKDLDQYRRAFHSDTWQPRQSGLCAGWCPVTDCEYWKPKRLRDRP